MNQHSDAISFSTIIDEIKIINDRIDIINRTKDIEKSEPLLCEEMPLRSTELKDLFSALSKAQTDMPIAVKTSINPYFKSNYASFSDFIKASRPSLCKNGLAVSQNIIERENGQRYLYTMLVHASGQFKASRVKINPPKSDIQEFGKYVSYLKRYCYASLVGVADAMEDDDGESNMKEIRDERKTNTSYKKIHHPTPLPSEETITRDQLEQLNEALEDHPDLVDMVMDGFKIQTLADIPKQQFNFTLKRINEIIAAKQKDSIK